MANKKDVHRRVSRKEDPYRTGPAAGIPAFLSEAGITTGVNLPERMAGYYIATNAANGDETVYKRVAVVTSKGWVPPVDAEAICALRSAGGEIIDEAISPEQLEPLTVNRPKRSVWHPSELKSLLGPDEVIEPVHTTTSALHGGLHRYIDYYIPSAKPEQVGAYLSQTVQCVIRSDYLNEDPTPKQLTTAVQEYYNVSEEEAYETLKHAAAAAGTEQEGGNNKRAETHRSYRRKASQQEPSSQQGQGGAAGSRNGSSPTESKATGELTGIGLPPDAELPEGAELPDEAESVEDIEGLEFPWEDSPTTKFADIGGYQDIKDQIKEDVIDPLTDPDGSYSRFAVDPARGLLFYGPPGTGKTLFARALANAINRPFVELTQASLSHHHINKSPQIIDRMFTEAQRLNGVVFIDEAEQLLGNRDRDGQQHAEDKKITNMFLTALTQEDKSFILLLTTNMREEIDDAILRPGRVDKKFNIGYPDTDTRLKILKLKLLNVPINVDYGCVRRIAADCEGWTGADIEELVNKAKRHAAKRRAQSLTNEDLWYGYQEIADSRNS